MICPGCNNRLDMLEACAVLFDLSNKRQCPKCQKNLCVKITRPVLFQITGLFILIFPNILQHYSLQMLGEKNHIMTIIITMLLSLVPIVKSLKIEVDQGR